MGKMVPFSDNYRDLSTNEGYQFEFVCERCGNGYQSTFKHSVTGFGGRIAQIGGDLVGGTIGDKASRAGWDAQWLRGGLRGKTHDKQLAEAVGEMQEHFCQCHRCGTWVCKSICWNDQRGLCTQCAPKLDQEVAALQADAQIKQLNEKIQAVDWTGDINYRDQGTAMCPSCHQEAGGGKFCQHCGAALAAAPAAKKKFCTNCGTEVADGVKFCGECGTPSG